MKTTTDLHELEGNITSARNILIVTHEKPSVDSLAASLSLYLALTQLGKNVTVACPDKPIVEFGNLYAIDKITDVLSNKNFVISLDYKEGSIEKVSYNIEGDKFNLVIQPKTGIKPFSSENVHFTNTGINADIIFVIDCEKIEDLKSFYTQEQEMYSKVPVINIDTHDNNNQFGTTNIIDSNSSSVTEIVAQTLKALNIPMDQDCATNILTGITWATDSFTKGKITPETFEIAASCLRLGGKLPGPKISVEHQRQIPIEESPVPDDTKSKKSKSPPSDWLEPKIYKGSTIS